MKGMISSKGRVYACIISSQDALFLPSPYTTFVMVSAIVASAVLLTFQVIPNSFSTMQSMMQQAVLPLIPASTPTLPPGYDSFYMDKDIPWAKVFVDGHQIRLPRIGVDEPLKLGRGHHLISWRAAPFQPQSCLLSIPFASDDTCRFAFDTVVHKSSLYQVILLHESLNTLPFEQRTALVGAIQAELGKLFTSEMVQPGEQYAGESGPVTARQPLRATLHFQLDTNSNWVCFANMQTHSGLLCGSSGSNKPRPPLHQGGLLLP